VQFVSEGKQEDQAGIAGGRLLRTTIQGPWMSGWMTRGWNSARRVGPTWSTFVSSGFPELFHPSRGIHGGFWGLG
jgi:hypothetical protein